MLGMVGWTLVEMTLEEILILILFLFLILTLTLILIPVQNRMSSAPQANLFGWQGSSCFHQGLLLLLLPQGQQPILKTLSEPEVCY